jgi:hypothetical protein
VINKQKRTVRLAKKGQLSRAAKTLTSGEIASSDEKTYQDLADLHPQREQSYFDDDMPHIEAVQLSVEDFSEAIHLAPLGAANGLTNWRYEHLKALLSDDDARKLQCFTKFAQMIIDAKDIPGCCFDVLRSGVSFGIVKPDGGTRPIVKTDVLRRWITRAIALKYREKWAEWLGTNQKLMQ